MASEIIPVPSMSISKVRALNRIPPVRGMLTVTHRDGFDWEPALRWAGILAAISAIAAFLVGTGKRLWGLGRWIEDTYRGLAKLNAWIDESRATADLLRARDSLLAAEAPVEMIWLGPDGLLLPERSDTVSRLTQDLFGAEEYDFRRNGWARQIAIKGGSNDDFEKWFEAALEAGENDTVRVTIERDNDAPIDRILLFRPIRIGSGPVLGVTIIFRHIEWRGEGLR